VLAYISGSLHSQLGNGFGSGWLICLLWRRLGADRSGLRLFASQVLLASLLVKRVVAVVVAIADVDATYVSPKRGCGS
jgi:hypothetical protein